MLSNENEIALPNMWSTIFQGKVTEYTFFLASCDNMYLLKEKKEYKIYMYTPSVPNCTLF